MDFTKTMQELLIQTSLHPMSYTDFLQTAQIQKEICQNLVTSLKLQKFRNSKFKANGIISDMTLYQSGKGSVTDLPQKIRKVLEERESI